MFVVSSVVCVLRGFVECRCGPSVEMVDGSHWCAEIGGLFLSVIQLYMREFRYEFSFQSVSCLCLRGVREGEGACSV